MDTSSYSKANFNDLIDEMQKMNELQDELEETEWTTEMTKLYFASGFSESFSKRSFFEVLLSITVHPNQFVPDAKEVLQDFLHRFHGQNIQPFRQLSDLMHDAKSPEEGRFVIQQFLDKARLFDNNLKDNQIVYDLFNERYGKLGIYKTNETFQQAFDNLYVESSQPPKLNAQQVFGILGMCQANLTGRLKDAQDDIIFAKAQPEMPTILPNTGYQLVQSSGNPFVAMLFNDNIASQLSYKRESHIWESFGNMLLALGNGGQDLLALIVTKANIINVEIRNFIEAPNQSHDTIIGSSVTVQESSYNITEVGQYIINETKKQIIPLSVIAATGAWVFTLQLADLDAFTVEISTSVLQQGVVSLAAGRSMLPLIAGQAKSLGFIVVGGGKSMIDSFWNIPWYGKSAIIIGGAGTSSYVYVKGVNQTAHDVTKVVDFVADTTKEGVKWISQGGIVQMGAFVVGAYAMSVVLNQGSLNIFKSVSKKRKR